MEIPYSTRLWYIVDTFSASIKYRLVVIIEFCKNTRNTETLDTENESQRTSKGGKLGRGISMIRFGGFEERYQPTQQLPGQKRFFRILRVYKRFWELFSPE